MLSANLEITAEELPRASLPTSRGPLKVWEHTRSITLNKDTCSVLEPGRSQGFSKYTYLVTVQSLVKPDLKETL